MSLPADTPAGGRRPRRRQAAAAGLGMFLAALDISVNVALPSITQHFNTDLQTVQWIIVVFIATRAGLVMGAGSFADRFGLKRVYLLAVVAYMAAMVAIAASPTLSSVVAFRVLQAVGVGALFAVSPAIAAQTFPAHRRGLGMGFTTASQALGMLAGTLGAGLLVQWSGWQSIFLGRVPFALIGLFLGWRYLQESREARGASPFDLWGAATLLAALLGLVIGLRLGRTAGWDSPVVLGLLLLAPVSLAAFWYVEKRAAWPVVPLDLLRVREVVTSAGSMFLGHLGVFVIWFIFPFYIVDGLGRGALALGAMLAVMAGLNTAGSGVGGWLCDRLGTRPVGVAGLLGVSAGLGLMGFLDAGSSLGQVGTRIAVTGAGLGLFQAAAYALMLGSVPQRRLGTASGALSLAQASGTVLSVATIGGVFAVSEGRHLSDLLGMGLPAAEVEARAFILGFQDVFRLGALIAALGAVVFLLSGRKRPPA